MSLFYFILLVLIVGALIIFSLLTNESCNLSHEAGSTYECGFDSSSLTRVPFSLRYFFLTLIFLLFDTEVLFMFFLPISLFSTSSFLFTSFYLLLTFILFLGLIYEWIDGNLEWSF